MELRQKEIVSPSPGAKQRRTNRSRGFTLAEVTIAVLVLSSAMIVMISLQSASLESSFRDERRQKALLAARSVFSAIEIDENPIEDIDVEAPLVELLAKRSPLDGLSDWNQFRNLQPFRARLQIANWPIPVPNIDPDAVKRVTLRVAWSDTAADAVELYYYIPKKR